MLKPFDNAVSYQCIVSNAKSQSLTPDYKGCTIHINARIGKVNEIPQIVGYIISDWRDDSTVASFCNGCERD